MRRVMTSGKLIWLFYFLTARWNRSVQLHQWLSIMGRLSYRQTWNTMARGVIMWFSMQQQTALIRSFMSSAVSLITGTSLSSPIIMCQAPTHLCWGMFTRYTMSISNPDKAEMIMKVCLSFLNQYLGTGHQILSPWCRCGLLKFQSPMGWFMLLVIRHMA